MLTKNDKTRRIAALSRLAIATREKMEPAAFVVYIEDTQRFSTVVLERACRHLATTVTWFPKVSELIEACQIVSRQLVEDRDQARRRALRPPPLSDEKWAEIQAQFRSVLKKHTMIE